MWKARATCAAISSLALTLGSAHAAPPPGEADLLSATCADLMAGLQLASPAASATAEQQRIALEAQDDIATGLVWVHGYLLQSQERNTLQLGFVADNIP